MNRTIHRYLND